MGRTFCWSYVLLLLSFIEFSKAESHPGKAYKIKLNDGNEIPVLGLGTSARSNTPEEVQSAIETAIDLGYRHIDTAAYYKTEKQVGLGLKNKILDGTVKREDVFITTKLWNDKHKEEDVIPALRQSLNELELSYVDLYLIHWPMSQDSRYNDLTDDYVDTWRAMEKAQKLGLAKSIGVSNFNQTQLQRILDNGKVKPVVNQIEVNPNMIQNELIKYCHNNDIHVIAYSPLGSISEKRFKESPNPPTPRIDDPILLQIGNKYNKTTVQVVLRYLLDRNLITIPKSVNPDRLYANLDIFDFKLSQDEVEKINEFNANYRVVKFDVARNNIHYPFQDVLKAGTF